MIDVGFNLLIRATLSQKSLSRVDQLVTSRVGGYDAYAMLRFDTEAELVPLHSQIEYLGLAVSSTYEEVVQTVEDAFNLVVCIIKQCDDEEFSLEGTVFIDDEGSCLANIDIDVENADESKMSISCKIRDLSYDTCTLDGMTVYFWFKSRPMEFEINPDSVDLRGFLEALAQHEDYAILESGASVFTAGPNVLAGYLRDVWAEGTEPWTSNLRAKGGGLKLIADDCNQERTVIEYRATIEGDEYSISLTAEKGKIWEIDSVWQDTIRFDVYWNGLNDLLLQVVLQNEYNTYDQIKRAIDYAVAEVRGFSVADGAGASFELADSIEEPLRFGDQESSTGVPLQIQEPESPIEKPRQPQEPEGPTEAKRGRGREDAPSEPLSKPVERVHIGDLIVRSSVRTCVAPEHDIREVTAVVCVFSPGKGVTEVSVDAFCCPQCKKYYVLDKDFKRLKRKGSLCCRVIERPGSITEFIPRASLGLSEQSFYNSLGYCVSRDEGLSAPERRAILDFAIVNGFKTQKQTISFLQWLIDFNGKRSNMSKAVSKWNSDIKYLMSSRSEEVERVRINRVFLTKHTRW